MVNETVNFTKTINQKQMERKDLLTEKIKNIFHDLSGIPVEKMDVYASFLELGFDSLFLTQATSKIKKAFKIKLSFRQLFEEAPNIDTLANYVDGKLGKDAFQDELAEKNKVLNPNNPKKIVGQTISATAPIQMPNPTGPLNLPAVNPNNNKIPANGLEGIIQQQLNLMQQQLALLSGKNIGNTPTCLLYTSPSPRDRG